MSGAVVPLKEGNSGEYPNDGKVVNGKAPLTDSGKHIVQDIVVHAMPHKTSPTRPHVVDSKHAQELPHEPRVTNAYLSGAKHPEPPARAFDTRKPKSRSSSSSSSNSSNPPPLSRIHNAGHHADRSKAKHLSAEARDATAPSIFAVPQRPDPVTYTPKLGRIFEEQGNTDTPRRRLVRRKSDRSAESTSPRTAFLEQGRNAKFHKRVASPLRHRPRLNLTSPSLLSILSSLAPTTTSSSGSNSTVTARSVASSLDYAPRVRTKKPTLTKSKPEVDARKQIPAKLEKVDVFNFLDTATSELPYSDEWDSSLSESESDTNSDESLPGCPTQAKPYSSPLSSPELYPSFKKQSWAPRPSINSDSGISMADEGFAFRQPRTRLHRPSGDSVSPTSYDGAVRNVTDYDDVRPLPGMFPDSFGTAPRVVSHSPGKHSQNAARESAPLSSSTFRGQASSPVNAPSQASAPPREPEMTSGPTPSGYGMLAAELSGNALPGQLDTGRPRPLYRRFEQLNHRILLHLQDELVELEEQLEYLDGLIMKQTPCTDGAMPSSSRRADARHGGVVHYQRTDVMGQIFLKLNQYNRLLVSYKSCNELEPATNAQVTSYKAWMQKNKPVVEAETRFLDCEADLVRVGPSVKTCDREKEKERRWFM